MVQLILIFGHILNHHGKVDLKGELGGHFCSDEFNLWNYELPIPQDTESLIKNISYKKNNTNALL